MLTLPMLGSLEVPGRLLRGPITGHQPPREWARVPTKSEHWPIVILTGALETKFRGSESQCRERINEGVNFVMKASVSPPNELLPFNKYSLSSHKF